MDADLLDRDDFDVVAFINSRCVISALKYALTTGYLRGTFA